MTTGNNIFQTSFAQGIGIDQGLSSKLTQGEAKCFGRMVKLCSDIATKIFGIEIQSPNFVKLALRTIELLPDYFMLNVCTIGLKVGSYLEILTTDQKTMLTSTINLCKKNIKDTFDELHELYKQEYFNDDARARPSASVVEK